MLEEEIDNLQNQWALGGFSDETVDRSAQLSAEAIGTIRGILFAIDLLDLSTDEEEDIER